MAATMTTKVKLKLYRQVETQPDEPEVAGQKKTYNKLSRRVIETEEDEEGVGDRI